MQNLIQHDILESIESNLALGNITQDDARRLKRLTHKLYTHIYSHYEEMEALNELTDESLILDIDIIDNQHAAELALKDSIISEKDDTISEKDAEIVALKEKLAFYQNKV